MIKFILLFCTILNICTAIFAPTWNTLRVTWGLPFASNAFASMPLTASDASKEGFTKISSQCSGTFNGNRYVKGNDTGVILLYDVNGNIAGIQTAIPKSLVSPVNDYPFNTAPVFEREKINGQDVYTLTAYFVDPDIICTTGRSASDIKKEATGSDLYIRNGTSAAKIPKNEGDMANTLWIKGGCFPSMGRHYWYNVRKDMSCQEFFPFFLLFNRGTLTGLGFAVFGDYETASTRYERPPEKSIQLFLKPVPDCIATMYANANIGGVTTLHVYFNINPINLAC